MQYIFYLLLKYRNIYKSENNTLIGGTMDRGEIKLFACRSGIEFGKKLCSELNKVATEKNDLKGFSLGLAKITQFADTELKVEILENVRGKDVYLVQSLSNKNTEISINENLMELLIFLDALKRAKALNITVLSPNMAYSRQDKQKGREPITAKLVAELIKTSGADALITMDLHADQISGFYDIDFDNLHASHLITDYLKSHFNDLNNWVFASPDAGGAERAEYYAKQLCAGYAISSKRRDYCKADTVEKIHILGEVEGKTVCIVDDIISTAGTLANAAKEMHKKGAKEIYAAATHCIFNEPATQRLTELYNQGILKGVIGIDSVIHKKEFIASNPWYIQVSASNLFAKVIYNINKRLSVSEAQK